MQANEGVGQEDEEIDLWQIADFLGGHVKPLVLGGVAAALLSLGAWHFLTPWKAVLVLNIEKVRRNIERIGDIEKARNVEKVSSVEKNGNVEKDGDVVPSIDFLTWRNFNQNLPLLAQQWVGSGRIKDPALIPEYALLGDMQWWQQNVTPNFALTKADTRSLLSISKQLQDSSADTILSISINGESHQPQDLSRRLNLVADFIQQGGAYLTARSLLGAYQSELGQDGEVRRQILQNEVELGYLRERAKKAERLWARFPQSKGGTNQQVLEIREGNAKYMPIESQLIAIYADIDLLEEKNLRLRKGLDQIKLKEAFLKGALPLLETETNGLQLIGQMLDSPVLKETSNTASNADLMAIANIRQDLAAIQSRFALGLSKNPASNPARPGPLLPLMGGFFGGGFLVLVWLLMRRGWQLHCQPH